jgi:uncharacterized protein YbaR (Trm112 family)
LFINPTAMSCGAGAGSPYKIRDGIPVMLEDEARQLSGEERTSLSEK